MVEFQPTVPRVILKSVRGSFPDDVEDLTGCLGQGGDTISAANPVIGGATAAMDAAGFIGNGAGMVAPLSLNTWSRSRRAVAASRPNASSRGWPIAQRRRPSRSQSREGAGSVVPASSKSRMWWSRSVDMVCCVISCKRLHQLQDSGLAKIGRRPRGVWVWAFRVAGLGRVLQLQLRMHGTQRLAEPRAVLTRKGANSRSTFNAPASQRPAGFVVSVSVSTK